MESRIVVSAFYHPLLYRSVDDQHFFATLTDLESRWASNECELLLPAPFFILSFCFFFHLVSGHHFGRGLGWFILNESPRGLNSAWARLPTEDPGEDSTRLLSDWLNSCNYIAPYITHHLSLSFFYSFSSTLLAISKIQTGMNEQREKKIKKEKEIKLLTVQSRGIQSSDRNVESQSSILWTERFIDLSILNREKNRQAAGSTRRINLASGNDISAEITKRNIVAWAFSETVKNWENENRKRRKAKPDYIIPGDLSKRAKKRIKEETERDVVWCSRAVEEARDELLDPEFPVLRRGWPIVSSRDCWSFRNTFPASATRSRESRRRRRTFSFYITVLAFAFPNRSPCWRTRTRANQMKVHRGGRRSNRDEHPDRERERERERKIDNFGVAHDFRRLLLSTIPQGHYAWLVSVALFTLFSRRHWPFCVKLA